MRRLRPYNLRPIEYGVDLVLFGNKYLGGPDLLAGVICGAKDALEPIRSLRGILEEFLPQHVYLLERGLKTFELRMQRHMKMVNGLLIFSSSIRGWKESITRELPHTQSLDCSVADAWIRSIDYIYHQDADWKATSRIVDAAKIPRMHRA